MSKVAKYIPEEIQALSKYVTLYCDISQQENQSKFNEAKHLLEQLILLLQPDNNMVNSHGKDILFIQANFQLKSKNFDAYLRKPVLRQLKGSVP